MKTKKQNKAIKEGKTVKCSDFSDYKRKVGEEWNEDKALVELIKQGRKTKKVPHSKIMKVLNRK